MADAYATIASGGVWHKPVAITKSCARPTARCSRARRCPSGCARSPSGASRTASPTRRPRSSRPTSRAAPARTAATGCPSAGKTGTTDEHSDGWFVGFTPAPGQRRVGRLSRRQRPHVHRVPRRLGGRRHVPGGDLGRLHEGGQGRVLRRLPAAEAADDLHALLRQVRVGGGRSSSSRDLRPERPVRDHRADHAPRPTTAPPTTDDGSTDDSGTDTGAGGFDPDLYESTPQPPPDG